MKTSILKSVGANWLGLGTDAVLGFVLTPYILHRLGPVAFGLWVLVTTFSGYYGLLDFGTRVAIIRYIARYKATDDKENLSRTVSSAFFGYLVVGLVAFLLTLLIAWKVEILFTIPREWVSPARILIVIFGIATAIGFPLSVFGGVLEGMQQFVYIGPVQSVATILKSVAIVIALESGRGLLSLGVITVLFNTLAALALGVIVFRIEPVITLRPSYAGRSTIVTLARFGAAAFWIGIATRLRFQSDSVVIGAFISVAGVSIFAVSSKLVTYCTEAVQSMATVLTPMFSHHDALGSEEGLRYVFVMGNFYSSLLAYPVALFLIILGKAIIRVWVGPAYILSYPILVVLTVPMTLYVCQAASTKILFGMARHDLLAKVLLLEGVANVLLSILFLRHYGLVGVAWGTALPLLATSLLFLPFHVCRQLQLKMYQYVLVAHIYPLLPCVPLAAALIVLNRNWPARNYLGLSSETLICGAVYLLSAGLFVHAARKSKFFSDAFAKMTLSNA